MALVQWNTFDSIGDPSYEEVFGFNGGTASGIQHDWLPLRPLAVARSDARNGGNYLPNGMPARPGNERPVRRPAGDASGACHVRTGSGIASPQAGERAGRLHRRIFWPPPAVPLAASRPRYCQRGRRGGQEPSRNVAFAAQPPTRPCTQRRSRSICACGADHG